MLYRQDSTYHSHCYTSQGALAGTRNSSMSPPWRINPMTHRTMSKHSTTELDLTPRTYTQEAGGSRDMSQRVFCKFRGSKIVLCGYLIEAIYLKRHWWWFSTRFYYFYKTDLIFHLTNHSSGLTPNSWLIFDAGVSLAFINLFFKKHQLVDSII